MKKHDSMRGYFAYELYHLMVKDPKIYLLTGDLGYAMFDLIKRDFPKQYFNCGASEQAMMDMAVGISLAGKIPVVYSITTFLLYRAFETIRTYINHEEIPVKLVGGGRDFDYKHDGWSHHSPDVPLFLKPLSNIKQYWPENKEEVTRSYVKEFLYNKTPSFISLRR